MMTMKSWKVGQQVVCDRQNKQLTECFVRSIDSESVVIFCPSHNTVICGQGSNLERLGWKAVDEEDEVA
jgi:1,4-alpha-glucan branching enzyme